MRRRSRNGSTASRRSCGNGRDRPVRACPRRACSARAQDERDVAAALIAGRKPKLRANEEKVEKEIGDAQALFAGAQSALDESGSAVMYAIFEARDPWLASVEAEFAQAQEDFRAARAQLKESLFRMAHHRGIRDWLRGLTGGDEIIGPKVDQRYEGDARILMKTGPFFQLDDPEQVTMILPLLDTIDGEDPVQPPAVTSDEFWVTEENIVRPDDGDAVVSKTPVTP